MKSKLIKGYGGFYKVKEDGTIWSCYVKGLNGGGKKGPWKLRKPHTVKKGHVRVQLTDLSGKKKTYSVHRLVLEAFVGPCPLGMECRHYPDQNPANNRLKNLSWATRSINQLDRRENGTQTKWKGQTSGASLNRKKVKKIRRLYASKKYTQTELAAKYNVKQGTISSIVTKRTWKFM